MEYIDFETGFMRELKNSTYVSIYCKVIDMMKEANFETPHLISSIGLLTRHGIKSNTYKDQLKHSSTSQIQKLHLKRRKNLAGLRDIIDQMSSVEGIVSRENAILLQSFIKPLRRYIGSRNVSDEMNAVLQIEVSVKYYYYIQLALEEANLTRFIDKLVKLNNEIMEMEEGRDDDNAASTLGLERKLKSYRDLKMVLEVLNSVIEIGEEESELAFSVASMINRELRRERGYVRMVDTKKEQKKERENNSSPTTEDDDVNPS